MFADVTSANIVGYAGSELNGGTKRRLMVPQFTSVSAKKAIKLKDLTPLCSTFEIRNNQITISQLQPSGKTIPGIDAKWNPTYSEWRTNNISASEMEIPEGTGLYVLDGVAATHVVTLQSAGEVNTTEDLVVMLNGGGRRTAMGNPFPVDVKMSDIIPEVVTEGKKLANNQITVSQLQSNGKTVPGIDAKWNPTYSEWRTNNVNASGMTIPAGQGLYVLCGPAETTMRVQLRITNPLKPKSAE